MNTELVFAAVQSASLACDLAGNVEHHISLAHQASTAGARLVEFTELSLTGYELAFGSEHPVALDDERLAPLRALASTHHAVIVAGAPVSDTMGHISPRWCSVPTAKSACMRSTTSTRGKTRSSIPAPQASA
jgi:predicted amidohydrolase